MTEKVMALLDTVLDTADWLEANGIKALARRDPREPGRREKERLEWQVLSVIKRMFARQRAIMKDVIQRFSAMRQKDTIDMILAALSEAGMWEDEVTPAALSKLLRVGATSAIDLFAEGSSVAMDLTPAKTAAIEWAGKHTGELIKGIDDITLDGVRAAVTQYFETPGMGLPDLMDMLPFDESRAELIAVTEVTAASAEGVHEAGLELQAEFPELVVTKIWHTNQDERVCDICDAMDEQVAAGGIEGEFKGGDGELYQDPPAHPNCRCWTTVETSEEE